MDSQVNIQQNDITIKNKTSSNGRLIILTPQTPESENRQCPR